MRALRIEHPGPAASAPLVLRDVPEPVPPSDELLVFTMEEKGLAVVDDPSTFFLGARDATLSGAAVSVKTDRRIALR